MAIYAVDFDNTLAVTRFPEIVEPKRKIVAAVKMLKANGHKVILWTSRAGRDLEAAVEWCHGQGLEFDAVNEPLPEQVARWGNDTRKVYADFYIDDKAMSVSELEAIMDKVVDIRGRERRKKAREHKKRKRYFLTQKLYGVAMLILTAVSVKLLEGDITVAFILVPMGIALITSKEMLIVNKYFWESEGV